MGTKISVHVCVLCEKLDQYTLYLRFGLKCFQFLMVTPFLCNCGFVTVNRFYDIADNFSTTLLIHCHSSVVWVSLVTPYWRNSNDVLTGQVLATPAFSMGLLLKELSLELSQPVFLGPQRSHKNTLAKSLTTLLHAHELVCVCVYGECEKL